MKAIRLLALASIAATTGAAAEELTYSVGVRAWQNTWRSNAVAVDSHGTATIPIQLTQVESDSVTSFIPFALVRWGNFGVSASALTPTRYSRWIGTRSEDIRRSEFDINGLYYILPGTSVSVGYKELRLRNAEDTGKVDIKIKGITVALGASAPLADKLGMFGSVGGGRFEADAWPSNNGLKTSYMSMEVGLSYAVPWFGKSTALTASYRQQRFKYRGYVVLGEKKNLTDTTYGPTLGFVTTF